MEIIPFTLAENAGINPGVVEGNIMSNVNKNSNYGYNAATDEYGDMVEMGVVDPKKVVSTALKNAASIALLLITTDAVMAEVPENESGWQPPAGWRPPSKAGLNHKY